MAEAHDALLVAQRLRAAPAPSAIPTSSTVWCASTCRSPLQRTSRSKRACVASAVSMWSRKPMPVWIRERPSPSRSSARRMSRLARLALDARRRPRAPRIDASLAPPRRDQRRSSSACRSAVEERLVLLVGARRSRAGSARAAGTSVTSRTSTPRRVERLEDRLRARPSASSNRMKLASRRVRRARPAGRARSCAAAARARPTSRAHAARAATPGSSSAASAASLREEVQVVGQPRLVDLAHELGRGQQVADAQAGHGHRLRERAQHDQVRVLARAAAPPLCPRTRGTPRRPPPGRRPRAHRRATSSRREQAARSGCWASRRS